MCDRVHVDRGDEQAEVAVAAPGTPYPAGIELLGGVRGEGRRRGGNGQHTLPVDGTHGPRRDGTRAGVRNVQAQGCGPVDAVLGAAQSHGEDGLGVPVQPADLCVPGFRSQPLGGGRLVVPGHRHPHGSPSLSSVAILG